MTATTAHTNDPTVPAAATTTADGSAGTGTRSAWLTGPPEVGATAQRTRTVEAEDIARFTAISGDRNPLHYDADLARGTVMGGLVVQGGVITAILNAVVAEDLPGPGTVYLHSDWSYRAAG